MKKTYISPAEVVVKIGVTKSLMIGSIRFSIDESGDEEYVKEQQYIQDVNLWDDEW